MEAQALVFRSRGDQGFYIAVGLTDRVAKEGHAGCVSTQATEMLDDQSGLPINRIPQLPTTMMAVHRATQLIAGIEVCWTGRANKVAGHLRVDSGPLQH